MIFLFYMDIKLYLEYVNDVSDNEIEIKWYYDNKKYEMLLKILSRLKYNDALMEVIKEANKYSYYKAYSKALLPEYSSEYKSFLISYLERKLRAQDKKLSYDRIKEIVRLIISLKPEEAERVRVLNEIYKDDILVQALDLEIKELKN